MSIRERMIILPLYIILHYCLTKNSDLMFIRCHNILLQSCLMVLTTSVSAISWHDKLRVCTITFFTISTTWIQTYVVILLLMAMAYFHPYVVLSLIRGLCLHTICALVFLFPLSPCFVDIFCTVFLCLNVVSFPVSLCFHSEFDSFSSCLHVGLNSFLV